jgi:hypothetical protein
VQGARRISTIFSCGVHEACKSDPQLRRIFCVQHNMHGQWIAKENFLDGAVEKRFI